MHYQVTGQRLIEGGYRLFTASGFGTNEHEAIADALASHPDRAAWQPHELRAEPDPINFALADTRCRNPRGNTDRDVTRDRGGVHPYVRQRGATEPAQSNLPTVESGRNLPIRSRHSPHHAVTKTACIAIVVGLALSTDSATKAADGGQTISNGTQSQRTGAAGAQMQAHVRDVGIRQPISVAAWIDTQRPHRSEPWLSPDSLGAQSERAVSLTRTSYPGEISPTENYLPTPAVGFTLVLSDRGLHSGEGVGTYFLGVAALCIGLLAILAMFAGAVWYRWPDEADEDEAKERVRHINEIMGGSL